MNNFFFSKDFCLKYFLKLASHFPTGFIFIMAGFESNTIQESSNMT
jgi:hypothetical protein